VDIVIAGAGEVGRQAAEVLVQDGHHVTLIDSQHPVIASLEEALDVRTLHGIATDAQVLREAGAHRADLFVAATNADEINLLSASLAKGLGARQAVARVHRSVYHDARGMDYAAHLGIDQLICPEYVTSLEIAGVIRDPGVHAVEHFARGHVEMERMAVTDQAPATHKPLHELRLPGGARVGTVRRGGEVFVPFASTVLVPGDVITLIGPTKTFEQAQKQFRTGTVASRRVILMGGTSTAVWLARQLARRGVSVRCFVTEHVRAQEMAGKLAAVTVLEANPTDPVIFEEERIAEADAFVTLTANDEINILSALQAKSQGLRQTIAVIHSPTYLRLVERLGIDRTFSPRLVASREIRRLAQTAAVQRVATLDEAAGVFELRVGRDCPALGRPLCELQLPAGLVLVAIQRGEVVRFPGANDHLEPDDRVVAIAQEELLDEMKRRFS
jgi:trk system potassium uptake protein TrkA